MKHKIHFEDFFESEFSNNVLHPLMTSAVFIVRDFLWDEFKKKNRQGLNSVTLNAYINSVIDDKYRNI
jgi:hypothetical protein